MQHPGGDLGCSRCRYSRGGCSRCRKSTFKPRSELFLHGNALSRNIPLRSKKKRRTEGTPSNARVADNGLAHMADENALDGSATIPETGALILPCDLRVGPAWTSSVVAPEICRPKVQVQVHASRYTSGSPDGIDMQVAGPSGSSPPEGVSGSGPAAGVDDASAPGTTSSSKAERQRAFMIQLEGRMNSNKKLNASPPIEPNRDLPRQPKQQTEKVTSICQDLARSRQPESSGEAIIAPRTVSGLAGILFRAKETASKEMDETVSQDPQTMQKSLLRTPPTADQDKRALASTTYPVTAAATHPKLGIQVVPPELHHSTNPRLSLWDPPPSPFGLIEEMFYNEPWALLLACMLLNKTNAKQVNVKLVIIHF